MQVVQTHLTQSTARGMNHLTAWLPLNPKVKLGSVVELDKNPEDCWTVEAQYAVQDVEHIQRGWGLDLPKTQRTER